MLKVISWKIPPEDLHRLDVAARALGETRSAFIRRAVEDAVAAVAPELVSVVTLSRRAEDASLTTLTSEAKS